LTPVFKGWEFFFQRHILEVDNAEMDLEEIGLEGKDLTCPKTGTSD